MRISDWSSDACSSDLDVEEVGGEFAVELDDVHRRHRKAGAIDHAADVAVELDVDEVIFRRFDFGRIFFGQVAQLGKVLVAEHRIAVERHLGVEHQQFVAVRSEEHTSELQSLMRISYAVFCLKKKK